MNAALPRIDLTTSMATTNCSFVLQMNDSPLIRKHSTPRPPFLPPIRCTPLQQQLQQQSEASGILCEPCSGSGWLLCDFCNGQKTNVRAANNRIYRRCPSCRAVGSILCPNCKVFKCVSFPNYSDGENLTF
ncbi:uncharacterized protein LOC127796321 [Diospyros lotus]|uniref:uncharacterized protein LOC127796321 n=1 Tax=Diospyros lotus TaxID=55363 RepID=UPI00225B12B0|nr:uncharacterized protein LOC127796321 [Diospyros lotus]